VTVTLKDRGGASTTAPSTANIADAALVPTPSSLTASKGVALPSTTVIATFTDGNALAQASDFSATSINWGDGTSSSAATVVGLGPKNTGPFQVQGSHTYTTPGTFTVLAHIVSSGGSKATARSTALVGDVPVQAVGLTLQPNGGQTVVAGAAMNGVLAATFTDPYNGPLSYYSAMINWGDQSGATAGTISFDSQVQGQYDVRGTHTYQQAGHYTVAVAITDGGGATSTVMTPVQVVAPPLTVRPVNINTVTVGASFTATVASISDPNPFDTASDFVATIDWGNGNVVPGQIVAAPGGGFNVVGSNTYTQLSGSAESFTITVSIAARNAPEPYVVQNNVIVQDGTITPVSQTFNGVEGTAFSGVAGVFQDSNPTAAPSSFTASINWGDGHTSPGTVQTLGGGNFSITGSNTFNSPGTYPVTITITDANGATAVDVSQANVAPAALSASAANTGITAFQGAAFSGPVVTFNDANPNALAGAFTATINWGDGQVTPGSVLAVGGGTFQVTGTNHQYANSGTFPVTVTVTTVRGSNLVLNTTAQVLAPLTGTTGNNGATSNPQPSFSGTAPAGATISLLLQSSSGASASGRTITDASGHWSLQVAPALPDGTYAATANLVSSTGVTLSSVNLGSVQIDTQGPAVAGIAFTPANGQLRVTFQDTGSGVNPAALANAGNYVLSLVSSRGLRNFGVVGPVQIVPGSGGQLTAIVTYNLGRKPSSGKYVLTLHANGLTDRAGNPLREAHFVQFPPSNVANPDYVAQFNVNKQHVAAGPAVYIPAGARAAAGRFGRLIRRR
jgi:hypothetical protein